MGSHVTVVVRVPKGGAWLARLVESLDGQTMPADAFDVVFVVDATAAKARERLDRLAQRRPNVRAVDNARDVHAGGDWVLDLGERLPRRKLTLLPTSLTELIAHAEQHGADAVVARCGSPSPALNAWFAPGEADAAAPAREALGPAIALLPTALYDADRDPLTVALAQPGVGRVGPFPLAYEAGEPDHQPAAPEVAETTATWAGGTLTVTARGVATGAQPGGQVLFSLRAGDGREHWPASTTTSVTADGHFAGSAGIDVARLLAEQPRSAGTWTVLVGVHGPDGTLAGRSPVPATALAPALVDGVPVVPTGRDEPLALDIGANRRSLVGRVAATAVEITESAAGTVLRIPLPDVHVHGTDSITGAFVLDGFELLARVATDGGRVRVEGPVSGLPGTVTLATRFGRGKPAPTGLALVIDPVGTMTVEPAGAPTEPQPEDRPVERQSRASWPISGPTPAPTPGANAGPAAPSAGSGSPSLKGLARRAGRAVRRRTR